MIADSMRDGKEQGIRHGTKAFSFSIANILGEKEEEKPQTPDTLFGSYLVPVDHSTPKPDSARLPGNDYETFRDCERTDILKQSLEIAFHGETLQQFQQEQERAPSATDDISPNSSFLSETPSRTSSPCDEPRRKKARTSFTAHQLRELETRYAGQRYIAAAERSTLARSLGLSDQQVKTWFQNRRMKEKRNFQDGEPTAALTSVPQTTMHPAMMGYPVQPSTNMLQAFAPQHPAAEPVLYRPQIVSNTSQIPNTLTLPIPAAIPRPAIQQPIPHFTPAATANSELSKRLLSLAGNSHCQSAFSKVVPGSQLPVPRLPIPGELAPTLPFPAQLTLPQRTLPPGVMTSLAPLTVSTPVYM